LLDQLLDPLFDFELPQDHELEPPPDLEPEPLEPPPHDLELPELDLDPPPKLWPPPGRASAVGVESPADASVTPSAMAPSHLAARGLIGPPPGRPGS
jgi:hypothetical protein